MAGYEKMVSMFIQNLQLRKLVAITSFIYKYLNFQGVLDWISSLQI